MAGSRWPPMAVWGRTGGTRSSGTPIISQMAGDHSSPRGPDDGSVATWPVRR